MATSVQYAKIFKARLEWSIALEASLATSIAGVMVPFTNVDILISGAQLVAHPIWEDSPSRTELYILLNVRYKWRVTK